MKGRGSYEHEIGILKQEIESFEELFICACNRGDRAAAIKYREMAEECHRRKLDTLESYIVAYLGPLK